MKDTRIMTGYSRGIASPQFFTQSVIVTPCTKTMSEIIQTLPNRGNVHYVFDLYKGERPQVLYPRCNDENCTHPTNWQGSLQKVFEIGAKNPLAPQRVTIKLIWMTEISRGGCSFTPRGSYDLSLNKLTVEPTGTIEGIKRDFPELITCMNLLHQEGQDFQRRSKE